MKTASKIKKGGNISNETLYYFLVYDPQLARFYLLLKTHKRLHDIPDRAFISICGHYTKNIYICFLGFSYTIFNENCEILHKRH